MELAVLRVVFQGMSIRLQALKRIDDSWPKKPKSNELFFPDALADARVYEVVGTPSNEAEREAAEDAASMTSRPSRKRRVRMRLFRWAKENSGLLAILQYDFPDASPAMTCPSIGMLVHLEKDGTTWKVGGQYLLETVHHHSVQAIRRLDVTGDGIEDLVIESNFGGAGTAISSLQIFDLSRGRFDELVNTESRLDSRGTDEPEVYTQVLDVGRTLQARGRRFCVSKVTAFDGSAWLNPPRVTDLCYPHGFGVETQETTDRNKMLARSH